MFDRVQILPNTLKHVETCLNSTKQGGQTEKCFAKQQCFSMFYRKTFTVWTGLNVHESEWKDPNKKFLHLSHTGLSRLNWNVKWLQNPRYLCLC